MIISILFIPIIVNAQRGCCSWHGGVSHCGDSGYYICNDGSRSPSCTCSSSKTTSTKVVYSSCNCNACEKELKKCNKELNKTIDEWNNLVEDYDEFVKDYDKTVEKYNEMVEDYEGKNDIIAILVFALVVVIIYSIVKIKKYSKK